MEAIVYCTTNLINGKKYIGSHNGKNPKYLGSGDWFKKALKKYGKDNFIRQTLWEGPEEYMREMEEYYIDYYSAYESQLFYNMSKKGVGGMAGKKQSEECLAKRSKAMRGRILSAEAKAKMSESAKLRKPNNIGKNNKKRSLEAIAKIREARIGTKHSLETKAKMSISAKNKWVKNVSR